MKLNDKGAMKTVTQEMFDEALGDLNIYIAEMLRDEGLNPRAIEPVLWEGRWGKKPIQMGVNWAALGTVKPTDAGRFAKILAQAAAMAANFKYNGYVIS